MPNTKEMALGTRVPPGQAGEVAHLQVLRLSGDLDFFFTATRGFTAGVANYRFFPRLSTSRSTTWIVENMEYIMSIQPQHQAA